MDTCAQIRVLLAERGGGETLPAEAAIHLAGCPECGWSSDVIA